MRLRAGLARAEFALLARPRATSRATDSLYRLSGAFFAFMAVQDAANPKKKEWSI